MVINSSSYLVSKVFYFRPKNQIFMNIW